MLHNRVFCFAGEALGMSPESFLDQTLKLNEMFHFSTSSPCFATTNYYGQPIKNSLTHRIKNIGTQVLFII
jgi:hypothetical protein